MFMYHGYHNIKVILNVQADKILKRFHEWIKNLGASHPFKDTNFLRKKKQKNNILALHGNVFEIAEKKNSSDGKIKITKLHIIEFIKVSTRNNR